MHHLDGPQVLPGGRLVWRGATLKTLIFAAFRVPHWRISGAAAWVNEEQYDIEGKPPADSGIKDRRYSWMYGIEDARLQEMLQALLVERFQLKFHRQTKTGNISPQAHHQTFTFAPHGRPSVEKGLRRQSGRQHRIRAGEWTIRGATMTQLVEYAGSYVLHAPVLDRTGLTGWFDYRQPAPLPEAEATTMENADSFRRMVGEIGLKLERTQGPIETFVIDHAEKPSAN